MEHAEVINGKLVREFKRLNYSVGSNGMCEKVL